MPYQHILLATDLSPASELAGRKAEALTRNSAATLTLLHVVEPLAVVYSAAEAEGAIPDRKVLELRLVEQARQELHQVARRLGCTQYQVQVRMGEVKGEVLRFAADNQVDLIVVGSRGHNRLGALLGSVASAILNHAPCDVLAVRE